MTPTALACRALGRGRRRAPGHPVYQWLDSFNPPRTLEWLASELHVSRPTLQYWILGERKSRRRIILTPIPWPMVLRVFDLSRGQVTGKDWPVVTGEPF